MKILILNLLILTGLFSKALNGSKYLIITYDSFYSAILPLADWKFRKGLKAKIVKLSEIGNTPNDIKNYIKNAYYTWQIKPEYVLLVGAVNYIPTWDEAKGYDTYYGDFEGDCVPEIAIGRLPALTSTQVQTMVTKILKFEKNPLLSPQWYLKGTTVINYTNDIKWDTIYTNDARIIHNYWNQYNYIQIDSFEGNEWGGGPNDSLDVINAVNNGREFVVYRGDGVGNWYYPFSVNPYQTSNGEKLPIVIGATCQTIAMQAGEEFVGESWLKAGTPSQLKGAVGYIGTTTIILQGAHLRSRFVRGFFRKIYQDSVFILGKAFLEGKRNILNLNDTRKEQESKSFNLLGDPELNIWTKSPDSFYIASKDTIPVGSQNLEFQIFSQFTSLPVKNAIICAFTNDTSIYVVEKTDSLGKLILPLIITNSGTLRVTVTKPNFLPQSKNVLILKSQSYFVNYYNHQLLDENNDGAPNPGENVTLGIYVKNFGQAPSPDVFGILKTSSPFVSITDSQTSFTSLLPDEIKFDSNAFNFNISPACTNGYKLPLDLLFYTASGDTWNYTLYLRVGAVDLETAGDSFSDELPYGNENNFWDPGERVLFFISLFNRGYAQAKNVNVIIKSLNPGLTVIDSSSYYGNIDPQTAKFNTADPFILKSDTSLDPGTNVPCSLFVYSETETLKLSYTIQVGYPPGTIIKGFQVPPPMQEGGWITGLAFDGQYLWVADYYSPFIYKLNPEDGSFVSYIYSSNFSGVYDLDFNVSDSTLWVHSQGNAKIYKVNLRNGTIIRAFNTPSGGYATGMGFDGTSLWTTKYNINLIYKCDTLGNYLGSYSLPYPGDGSRGITLDRFGRSAGTLIHTRVYAGSTIVYEWDRITHTPTGNVFVISMGLRGIEFDPRTGDYWVSEPHSSIRGYIYKVVGFHHKSVGIEEKDNANKYKNNLLINKNIFTDNLKIKLYIPYNSETEISIFDPTGRKINTIFNGILTKGQHEFNIRKKLNSGIYFIFIKNKNIKKQLKIIKLR